MIALVILYSAHVPSYPPYTDNCAGVHKSGPELSQVAYLRGSGGIEFHVETATDPVDTVSGQEIDFDVILRDKVDLTSFAVYVGCGGCMMEDALAPRVFDLEYQEADLEPFTQTRIRSLFPKEKRKFDSSLLHPDVCNASHFTVRIKDFQNRTNGEPLVWSAVLGLREFFELDELASFPVYVLLNHGMAWSDIGWTYPVCLFFLSPLFLVLWRSMGSSNQPPLNSNPMRIVLNPYGYPTIQLRFVDPRESLYDLAIHAFVAAALEEFIHLVIAQYGIAIGYQLFLGLAVIAASQGIPILFVTFVWNTLLYSRNLERQKFIKARQPRWHDCYSCSGNSWWGIGEIIMSVVFGVFLFGAGFYVGPACLFVTGILRLSEINSRVIDTSLRMKYELVDPAAVPSGLPVAPLVVQGEPLPAPQPALPPLLELKG